MDFHTNGGRRNRSKGKDGGDLTTPQKLPAMCPHTMSPPPAAAAAAAAEISPYWDDQQLILLLDKCTPEFSLPSNVLPDLSPYEHPPSELPGEIWYLVHSTEKKESIYGFWKAKGEPCKIYSDSTKNGWRTTLEFLEGEVPNGQSTGWLMQEYSITRKDLNGEERAKELLLCRVFHCRGHDSDNMMPPQNCEPDIDSLIAALPELVSPNVSETNIDSLIAALPELVSPNTSVTSNQHLPSESKLDAAGAIPEVVNEKTSFSPLCSVELNCIQNGDYLEWNDLKDPMSQSSSSQNSSGRRKLSEECFDSLLMETEEQEKEYTKRRRQSSSKYNFTPSVRSNDVVLQPLPSQSLLHDARRIEPSEGSEISSTITGGLVNDKVQEHTAKGHHSDSRSGSTKTTPTIHKTVELRGEKARSSWTKNLKMYCCFITF